MKAINHETHERHERTFYKEESYAIQGAIFWDFSTPDCSC
jgi:hypothetical protein